VVQHLAAGCGPQQFLKQNWRAHIDQTSLVAVTSLMERSSKTNGQ
jgi:hypothetical protein